MNMNIDNIKKLPRSQQIIAASGLLLLIDLLFLPWHRVTVGIPGLAEVSASRSAVQSPIAFLGFLAFLGAAALVAHVVVSEFTEVELPELPVTWGRADLIASVTVAGLLLLKLVLKPDHLGIGAWMGLLLAAALAYGGVRRYQETEAVQGAAEVA